MHFCVKTHMREIHASFLCIATVCSIEKSSGAEKHSTTLTLPHGVHLSGMCVLHPSDSSDQEICGNFLMEDNDLQLYSINSELPLLVLMCAPSLTQLDMATEQYVMFFYWKYNTVENLMYNEHCL